MDFAAVIAHIRKVGGLPTPPPQVADRDVSLYEQRVRAPPESRPSYLLPWSDASSAKMRRINEALRNGSLESTKGPALLKPRAPLKRRFYAPLDGSAQAAEVTHKLCTLLKTEPEVLRKDMVPLTSTEAKDLSFAVSGAASIASWMDWNLLSMHDFERHIPGERRQLFRDLATTMSRALAQLNDFIFTAWGNLELKRRDVAFQHLHVNSAKEILPPLRAAPLFGAALVPDEAVAQAIEKRNRMTREDFMLASVEPPRKKFRQFDQRRRPSFNSSARRNFRRDTPSDNRAASERPSNAPSQQHQAPRGSFKKRDDRNRNQGHGGKKKGPFSKGQRD